ncbi:MAG: biopolymer transporter ExbD [Endomicrobiia bacterium]
MKLKPQKEEEVGFQMSPMIDIVFQLIIFFMVVSTFNNLQVEEDIKLPVAFYSQEKQPNPGEILINIKVDGTYVVNQRKYDENSLVDLIYTTVKKNPEVDFSATIRADARTPHKYVLKAIKACSENGISKIAFTSVQRE